MFPCASAQLTCQDELVSKFVGYMFYNSQHVSLFLDNVASKSCSICIYRSCPIFLVSSVGDTVAIDTADRLSLPSRTCSLADPTKQHGLALLIGPNRLLQLQLPQGLIQETQSCRIGASYSRIAVQFIPLEPPSHGSRSLNRSLYRGGRCRGCSKSHGADISCEASSKTGLRQLPSILPHLVSRRTLVLFIHRECLTVGALYRKTKTVRRVRIHLPPLSLGNPLSKTDRSFSLGADLPHLTSHHPPLEETTSFQIHQISLPFEVQARGGTPSTIPARFHHMAERLYSQRLRHQIMMALVNNQARLYPFEAREMMTSSKRVSEENDILCLG